MKTNKNNEKVNNFKRISENRVNKILSILDQLKNLTNKSFYEYSEDDIERIFMTIQKELDDTKKKLLDEKKRNGRKRFEL